MSRLENKLQELGYEKVFYDEYEKIMSFNKEVKICIRLTNFNERIKEKVLIGFKGKTKQPQFDLEQQAFNQLQKDLEVLKEYEN